MGFTELLTIVFVILRATNVISWGWWLVFLPEIIAVILYVILAIVFGIIARKQHKDFTRRTEELFKNESGKNGKYCRRIYTRRTRRTYSNTVN